MGCDWIQDVGWVQPFEELPPVDTSGSVTLLKQASSHVCSNGSNHEQASFGYFSKNSTMWTYYGCRGTFKCDSVTVDCPTTVEDTSKPQPWSPTYNLCPCNVA